MKHISLRLLVALAIMQVLVAPSTALSRPTPRGITSYAKSMEFYYLAPKPESLPGILRAFDAQGVLADSQKRLALAAFLAETLRAAPEARTHLWTAISALGQDGKRTLAWAIHLAQLPDEESLLNALLGQNDALLRKQIAGSPGLLHDWKISSEATVLQMYWTAFMACGSLRYLDAIIQAALQYAHLNARGERKGLSFPMFAAAAASLYELAPRHPVVSQRLENFLRSAAGPEAETLRAILRK